MAPRSKVLSRTNLGCPKGWELLTVAKNNGKTEQYYGNADGQRFYSIEELNSYIQYAKKNGLSIYAPGLQKPTAGTSNSQRRASLSNNINLDAANQNQGDKDKELQCATSLLNLTNQTAGDGGRRKSRRLSGEEPEITNNVDSGRALEYILKKR